MSIVQGSCRIVIYSSNNSNNKPSHIFLHSQNNKNINMASSSPTAASAALTLTPATTLVVQTSVLPPILKGKLYDMDPNVNRCRKDGKDGWACNYCGNVFSPIHACHPYNLPCAQNYKDGYSSLHGFHSRAQPSPLSSLLSALQQKKGGKLCGRPTY